MEIEFQKPVEINALLIKEYIRLGQRIRSFNVEAMVGEEYEEIATGTTVGNRRIIQFPKVKTGKLRLTFDAKAPVVISTIKVYNVPERRRMPYLPGRKDDLPSSRLGTFGGRRGLLNLGVPSLEKEN